MTITLARGLAPTDIRCPECSGVRTVNARHASRWRNGEFPGVCNQCRRGRTGRVATDAAIGYWLRMYGVDIPKGRKARDVLTASGIPPALAQFAREAFPP